MLSLSMGSLQILQLPHQKQVDWLFQTIKGRFECECEWVSLHVCTAMRWRLIHVEPAAPALTGPTQQRLVVTVCSTYSPSQNLSHLSKMTVFGNSP